MYSQKGTSRFIFCFLFSFFPFFFFSFWTQNRAGREFPWPILELFNFIWKIDRQRSKEENGCEWKERGKAEGGKKKKDSLITETLTQKKGEADTSGNQRNASQLGDTSIHPALSAVFLLKLRVSWEGGGRGRKNLRNKNQIEGWAKTSSAKTLRPWDRVPEQPGRTSLNLGQKFLCFSALPSAFHTLGGDSSHTACWGLLNYLTGQLAGQLSHSVWQASS